MPKYYTERGKLIRNNEAYALTGAPMYKSKKRYDTKNINEEKVVYQVNCAKGKKYIGETNDFDRRMSEHFGGRGSKVTKKFKPYEAKELERCPGYFAKDLEQEYTEEKIDKYGYNKVRGGCYTNSKTLK
jgi:predicted GIY-YIG superfamily endonuclease|tara:strand:+ start:205 stop:591 length:387 start_codon:yes stop_codon:yes gene_type:complete